MCRCGLFSFFVCAYCCGCSVAEVVCFGVSMKVNPTVFYCRSLLAADDARAL